MTTNVMIESANGMKMMSYQEMLDEMKSAGIEMEFTGEYWKAVRYTDKAQNLYDVVWQDSASDEAYDEASAIVAAYGHYLHGHVDEVRTYPSNMHLSLADGDGFDLQRDGWSVYDDADEAREALRDEYGLDPQSIEMVVSEMQTYEWID